MSRITLAEFETLAREGEVMNKKIEEIRRHLADYMAAEGCGCCSDYAAQKESVKNLAKLLDVPPYDDGSGHDFDRFRTSKKD